MSNPHLFLVDPNLSRSQSLTCFFPQALSSSVASIPGITKMVTGGIITARTSKRWIRIGTREFVTIYT